MEIQKYSAMFNQTDLLFFSDEQESVQKRTFTKWINTHLTKVIHGFEFIFFFLNQTFPSTPIRALEYRMCQICLSRVA